VRGFGPAFNETLYDGRRVASANGRAFDFSSVSADFVSEVDVLGLETVASDRIAVPRVTAAPIAMECRFRQCLEFGDTRSRLIVGEVVAFHIRDDLLSSGKIETEKLDPIARIAGPRYARLGEIVTLKPVFQTSK